MGPVSTDGQAHARVGGERGLWNAGQVLRGVLEDPRVSYGILEDPRVCCPFVPLIEEWMSGGESVALIGGDP